MVTATIALIIGVAVALWAAKREKVSQRQVWLLILTCLASVAFFARLFYSFIFEKNSLIDGIKVFFDFSHSGIASSGSFIGVIVGAYIFYRFTKAKIWKLLDAVGMSLMPVMAIGRIGCLFAGCCYGKIAEVPWAIHLHNHLRHPTQIYDMISASCIFAFMLWYRKRKHFDGSVFLLTLILYGIFRFIIEFYRVGERLLGISYSQYAYGLMFLLCAAVFLKKLKS
jgi:prolipoprotein diacylglyceryl transferase